MGIVNIYFALYANSPMPLGYTYMLYVRVLTIDTHWIIVHPLYIYCVYGSYDYA